jgi:hypothetical protein
MRFRIHNRKLSEFFRQYHADAVNDPKYKRGDVTEMDSQVFDHVADNVWGLQFESYNGPHYTFRVVDREKLQSIGLERRGEVLA